MKTVHDLLPDPNERTSRERDDNAAVLARLRKGPATHSELDTLCLSLAARLNDLYRYLKETEGRTIDRKGTNSSDYVYKIREIDFNG